MMKEGMLICVVICCLFFVNNVNAFSFQCGDQKATEYKSMQEACDALASCSDKSAIITPDDNISEENGLVCKANGGQSVSINGNGVASDGTWLLTTGGNSTTDATFALSGVTFAKCSGGPCVHVQAAHYDQWLNVTFSDMTIQNVMGVSGVRLDGKTFAHVSKSKFQNIASRSGAAFRCGSDSILDVGKSNSFEQCLANGYMQFTEQQINHDEPTGQGGAIFSEGQVSIGVDAQSEEEGNTFLQCVAIVGGAIFTSLGEDDPLPLSIGSYNRFEGCGGGYSGGAINSAGEVRIGSHNIFKDNAALVAGAIAGPMSDEDLAKDNTFTGNMAPTCSNIGFNKEDEDAALVCKLEPSPAAAGKKDNTYLYVWIVTVVLFIGYVVFKYRQGKAAANRQSLLG